MRIAFGYLLKLPVCQFVFKRMQESDPVLELLLCAESAGSREGNGANFLASHGVVMAAIGKSGKGAEEQDQAETSEP